MENEKWSMSYSGSIQRFIICKWFDFDVNLHQNIELCQDKVYHLQNQMLIG
mgnify:CR=1 FL=1